MDSYINSNNFLDPKNCENLGADSVSNQSEIIKIINKKDKIA